MPPPFRDNPNSSLLESDKTLKFTRFDSHKVIYEVIFNVIIYFIIVLLMT